jgi:hypothetical protein
MSTPPPGEYGTKTCTGRAGNGACAETAPLANIATVAAIAGSRRPSKLRRKNLSLKASSRYDRFVLWLAPAAR